ncbi:hypothetical protein BOTBODRAFT_61491 [Botryobasidium botryosum FD-172 SS1]|uniref:F-box domain-containing protein n=1 Tax=Botryobasidium botryosum (strain FD-172 SS1) TaxID=930990 RepID=A0A067N249_BOTB1|nr:hypothetical protein BOTBODRAFT_61491 [Botryobasidium botryosum FD-172 SS1]
MLQFNLPAELFMNVLQLAVDADSPDGAADLTVLTASSLVCKLWSPFAQTMLFRTIRLASMPPLRSFRDAITDARENGRVLAKAVQCLHIQVDITIGRGTIHPHDMAKLLVVLPNLHTLYVNFNSVIAFPLASLGFLRHAEAPIKTLCIVNAYLDQLGAAHQILQRFPTIRTFTFRSKERLAFTNDGIDSIASELPPSGPFSWKGDSYATDTPGLRCLEISKFMPHWRKLCEIMEENGSTLHTLRIGDLDDGDVAEANHITGCVNLREFVLGHLPPPAILDALPPTLEHLVITDRFMRPMSEFPSIKITTDALHKYPNLRALTLTQVRDDTDSEFVELKAKCASLGVDFRFDPLPRTPVDSDSSVS